MGPRSDAIIRWAVRIVMFTIDQQFIEILEHAWGKGFGHFFIKGDRVQTRWYRGDRIDPEQMQPEGTHFFYAPLPTATPKPSGQRGLKTDYVSMSMLFVDCDKGLPDIDDLELRPNYIIHTSPNRGHLLYLLREPFVIADDSSRSEAENVWIALSLSLTGDEGSRDLGHLGRVPGSMNYKVNPPYKVSLEVIDGAPLREWEELVEIGDKTTAPEDKYSKSITNELSVTQAGDGRLPRIRSEIARLARNYKGEALRRMAHAMNEAGTVVNPPYEDKDEIDRLCRTAQAKFGGQGIKRMPLSPEQMTEILGTMPSSIAQWPHKHAPTIDNYALALEETGVDFRRNLLSGSIHLGETPLEDKMFDVLYMLMDRNGYNNKNRLMPAISIAASKFPFHPIRDYWESVEWDQEDYIGKLCGYFTDKHGFMEVWMRRWCIGSVARMLEANGAQNRMWVLEGRQGLGKSYLARWLAGPLKRYYREGPLDPNNKDDRLRMLDTWINEVGELGATFRRSDRDALKFFLTMQTVKERRPYAHYDTDGIARTSFIGTINDEGGFLTDPTGNRRYMISSFSSIDWAYTKEVDVQQIWAQSLALYRAGETWNLLPDESEISDGINKDYEDVDPMENYLRRLFDIDIDNPSYWMSNGDIQIEIDRRHPDVLVGRISKSRLGRTWTAMGLHQERRTVGNRQDRGWAGVMIKHVEVA